MYLCKKKEKEKNHNNGNEKSRKIPIYKKNFL